MKTSFQSKEEAIAGREWLLFDAEGQVLGRLASKIAAVLKGKNSPKYCPHNDGGDFVVVVNADKVVLTGKKAQTKVYYRHTNFTGGIKKDVAGDLLAKKPEKLIQHAVKGMLPKTTLGRAQLSKLKVYKGSKHPHQAQCPKNVDLN